MWWEAFLKCSDVSNCLATRQHNVPSMLFLQKQASHFNYHVTWKLQNGALRQTTLIHRQSTAPRSNYKAKQTTTTIDSINFCIMKIKKLHIILFSSLPSFTWNATISFMTTLFNILTQKSWHTSSCIQITFFHLFTY